MTNKLRFTYRKIFALLLIAIIISSYRIAEESNFAISRNIDIFTSLFKEINAYYIEDIDPDALTKVGINAMLESLDPYTNYIPAEEMDRYRKLTTGEYYGIGAKIEDMSGKKVITMTVKGYSAYKNGLRIGDEVIAVNGRLVANQSEEYINNLLKSYEDHEVELRVRKYGTQNISTLKLSKNLVKIKNVPSYGKINEHIGYIKLSEFTFGASDEVARALKELKNEGISQLVLDLRDNPGGLLNEAIDVSNIFIEKGREIVSTKGKIVEWNKSYKSLNNPIDTYLPMVVLVNGNSASAAEIVAGVLQDYDRAVLVGEKTYGKGLVQATRTLSHNAKLKITTAKYYIPSGRCIQSIDYDWDANASHHKLYETANGRKVYDGQGIEPDVVTDHLQESELITQLLDKGMIFEYANWYYYRFSKKIDPYEFTFDEADYTQFTQWLEAENFNYQSSLEADVALVKEKIKLKNQELLTTIGALEQQLAQAKDKELNDYSKSISLLLQQEIVNRANLERSDESVRIANCPVIDEAIKVLHDRTGYKHILGLSAKL